MVIVRFLEKYYTYETLICVKLIFRLCFLNLIWSHFKMGGAYLPHAHPPSILHCYKTYITLAARGKPHFIMIGYSNHFQSYCEFICSLKTHYLMWFRNFNHWKQKLQLYVIKSNLIQVIKSESFTKAKQKNRCGSSYLSKNRVGSFFVLF